MHLFLPLLGQQSIPEHRAEVVLDCAGEECQSRLLLVHSFKSRIEARQRVSHIFHLSLILYLRATSTRAHINCWGPGLRSRPRDFYISTSETLFTSIFLGDWSRLAQLRRFTNPPVGVRTLSAVETYRKILLCGIQSTPHRSSFHLWNHTTGRSVIHAGRIVRP